MALATSGGGGILPQKRLSLYVVIP